MKILFICTKEFDYLQDLTFSGLCKTVGAKNICVLPWNSHFFLPFKKYPKNLGFVDGQIISSIRSRLFLSNFDVVIVASAKPDCFHTYNNISHRLSKNIKTIFIDGGDRSEVGGDLDRLKDYRSYEQAMEIRPFDVVLKREMIIGNSYPNNVFPFPFCWNLDRRPTVIPEKKKYDVSFWAVESHPIRTQALSLIRDKFDCKENGTDFKQNFRKYKRKGEFYLEELASCKVVLNFRGVGWDTLRYWEVPSLETLLISQKPQIEIPNNFEHERNIIFCDDDLGNLIELCAYYLNNEEKRTSLGKNAYNHLSAFHTDIHRAKKLLSFVK